MLVLSMVDTSSIRTPSRSPSHRSATRGRHPSRPTRRPSTTSAGSRGAGAAHPRSAAASSRLARVPNVTRLTVLVGVLCVFGLVMVGSASPVISMGLYGSTWAIFIRQVMWMGVGVAAMLAFSRIDYRKWRKIRVPLLVGTMGMLVAVLTPGRVRAVSPPAVRVDETCAHRLRCRFVDPSGGQNLGHKVGDPPGPHHLGDLIAADSEAAGHGYRPGSVLCRLRDPLHGRRSHAPDRQNSDRLCGVGRGGGAG